MPPRIDSGAYRRRRNDVVRLPSRSVWGYDAPGKRDSLDLAWRCDATWERNSLDIACEERGAWDEPELPSERDGHGQDEPGPGEASSTTVAVIERLTTVIDEVVSTDLDALGEPEIKQQLREVQREMNRLAAYRSKAAGTLEQRAMRAAGPGRESRAVQPTRTWAEEELGLTPSEAKRAGETGRRVSDDPEVEQAYTAGLIREEHVRVITDTLRRLSGAERAEVRTHLVEAARSCTPVALGRLARRLLAKADHEAAQAADDRRHARRYARVAETADGMLAINALLSGVDKEIAQTAIDAFRTQDAKDEHRTPEQRTADALVAALQASLDIGKAPTQHGIRPHVILIASLPDYASGEGTGDGLWSGPIAMDEIRRVSKDATITRVLTDSRSVPIEVSEGKRYVATGLWKALVARDRGCRWPGCSAPPAWCDAAHGEISFRAQGPLSVHNGVLLCRRHHRKVDLGKWTIDIRGPDIGFVDPNGRRVESPPP